MITVFDVVYFFSRVQLFKCAAHRSLEWLISFIDVVLLSLMFYYYFFSLNQCIAAEHIIHSDNMLSQLRNDLY